MPPSNNVDWANLAHAYGPATDLPRTLAQVASDDPDIAEDALDDLFGTICHQGSVVSATAPAVGVLYELVADPGTHHRAKILELLSDIAQALWNLDDLSPDEFDDGVLDSLRECAADAWTAVAAGVPSLVGMLDDADPSVRAAAPFVLADFPERGDDLIPLLQRKASSEEHPGAAASMVLAIGDLCSEQDAPSLEWLHDRASDGRREVRASVAVGLLWCGVDVLDDGLLQALADELEAAGSALDDQLWSLVGGRDRLLLSALDDHPDGQIRLARTMLGARNRLNAVRRAADVLTTWRAAPAELLPAFADLLTDPSEDVVREAAWTIKEGGPDVASVADALVPLLDHPADVIAGSALEALARIGDARCLHPLIAELAEPRRACYLNAALAGMREHSDDLIGPVRAALRAPKRGTGFGDDHLTQVLDGVAAWGDHARPLLPEIVALVEQGRRVSAAAGALASLGPDAAEAVPVLSRLLEGRHRSSVRGSLRKVERHQVAWALWQITRDGGEPLRVLRGELGSRLHDDDADRLYALGAAAAPAVPLLEPLLDDPMFSPGAPAILHRVTGDTGRLLPYLLDVVSPTPGGMLAIRCLADIGQAAAATAPAIREIAESPRVLAGGSSTDRLTTDRAYQATAATALARITGEQEPT